MHCPISVTPKVCWITRRAPPRPMPVPSAPLKAARAKDNPEGDPVFQGVKDFGRSYKCCWGSVLQQQPDAGLDVLRRIASDYNGLGHYSKRQHTLEIWGI